VEYTYDWESSPEDVLITTSGRASVEDLEAMGEAGFADPRSRPGMMILIDHRATEYAALSYADVTRRADSIAARRELDDARIAVVVSRPADFGVWRIFDTLLSDRTGAQLRIFHTMEEARAWLIQPDAQAS
jgi:hypothetical protein